MCYLSFFRNLFHNKIKINHICTEHQIELSYRIIRKYKEYFAKKGILLNVCYISMSLIIKKLFIDEINKNLTKKEIREIKKSKCIYENEQLKDKIKEIEDIVLNILIQKEDK